MGSVLLVLTALWVSSLAWADTIFVPFQYSTIQEAVDAAMPGDEVEIDAMKYSEAVRVDKAITISGTNAEVPAGTNPGKRGQETVMDGGFLITADGVVLRGMTIRNGAEFAGTSGLHAVVVQASDCVIENCIIEGVMGKDASAILSDAAKSSDLIVEAATIRNNERGIRLEKSSGTLLRCNRIESNNGAGEGIVTIGLSDLLLEENLIANHKRCGWVLRETGFGIVSKKNRFENNAVAILQESGEKIRNED